MVCSATLYIWVLASTPDFEKRQKPRKQGFTYARETVLSGGEVGLFSLICNF